MQVGCAIQQGKREIKMATTATGSEALKSREMVSLAEEDEEAAEVREAEKSSVEVDEGIVSDDSPASSISVYDDFENKNHKTKKVSICKSFVIFHPI